MSVSSTVTLTMCSGRPPAARKQRSRLSIASWNCSTVSSGIEPSGATPTVPEIHRRSPALTTWQ
jgi:hypothetical protein